jgi:hypothetical protein
LLALCSIHENMYAYKKSGRRMTTSYQHSKLISREEPQAPIDHCKLNGSKQVAGIETESWPHGQMGSWLYYYRRCLRKAKTSESCIQHTIKNKLNIFLSAKNLKIRSRKFCPTISMKISQDESAIELKFFSPWTNCLLS